MPSPYKLTQKKENEFRRQKAAFKKLKALPEQEAFLASCEWFPMEFWRVGQQGLRWYPTAVGIIMLDDLYPFGFLTPQAAEAHGHRLRAAYAAPLPLTQPPL